MKKKDRIILTLGGVLVVGFLLDLSTSFESLWGAMGLLFANGMVFGWMLTGGMKE